MINVEAEIKEGEKVEIEPSNPPQNEGLERIHDDKLYTKRFGVTVLQP